MARSGQPVAVVTGGAGGIGAAIARRFAADGHVVVVADLDEPAAQRIAAEIGGTAYGLDVSDHSANRDLVSYVRTEYGRLNLVALHAGANTGQSPDEPIDVTRYRRAVGVNVDSVVYGLDAAVPLLRDSGGGAVVVTASLACLAAELSHPLYTLTKSAILAYARAMSGPLATHGITVNAILPGYVDTPMISDFRAPLVAQGFPLLSPEDVASAVATVVASGRTGDAWPVVPGRTPEPFAFPPFPWPLLPDGSPAPTPVM